jgi:hypothetical protein
MERQKWVVVTRHYRGWEGTEFNIGFEGSQALPVCPYGVSFDTIRDLSCCCWTPEGTRLQVVREDALTGARDEFNTEDGRQNECKQILLWKSERRKN